MRLQESGEMYLETIYVLSRTGKPVRSIDISEHMGFSKPSVSRAVSILKSGGYVETDKDGYLHLTSLGLETAEKTYERHRVITEFFVRIGVDEKIAAEDASKMEHIISDESFEALKKHFGLE